MNTSRFLGTTLSRLKMENSSRFLGTRVAAELGFTPVNAMLSSRVKTGNGTNAFPIYRCDNALKNFVNIGVVYSIQ